MRFGSPFELYTLLHEQNTVRRYANNVKIHSAPIVKLAVRDGIIFSSSNDTYLKYFKLVDVQGVKVWDKFGFQDGEEHPENMDSLDEVYGNRQTFVEDGTVAMSQKKGLYDIQETLEEELEHSTIPDCHVQLSESNFDGDSLIYASMLEQGAFSAPIEPGLETETTYHQNKTTEAEKVEENHDHSESTNDPELLSNPQGLVAEDINSDLLSYIQSHTMSELLEEIQKEKEVTVVPSSQHLTDDIA